jgi:hypothetical protein
MPTVNYALAIPQDSGAPTSCRDIGFFAGGHAITVPWPGTIAGNRTCSRSFTSFDMKFPIYLACSASLPKLAKPFTQAELTGVLDSVIQRTHEAGRVLKFRAARTPKSSVRLCACLPWHQDCVGWPEPISYGE